MSSEDKFVKINQSTSELDLEDKILAIRVQASKEDDFFHFELEGGDEGETKEEQKQVEKENKKIKTLDENANPKLGILYMLINVFLSAFSWLAVKKIYIHAPSYTGVEVLFLRSASATIVIFLMVNKNIKKIMFDEVNDSNKALIGQRCVQSLFLKLIQYSAMKYFTLTTISVFYNIAPFCTLFFAAIFLNETIQRGDVYAVILCFISVLIITYGMTTNSAQLQKVKMTAAEYARFDHFSYLAFICLILAPIMKAAQNIILRKVRKINSKTMSCYSNPFLGITCGLYLIFSGRGMGFTDLLWKDHTLLALFIFLGSINVMQQVLKVMAHQHEEASKLAVFGYLQIPYQLILDVLVINSQLTFYQTFGVSVMLLVITIKVYGYYYRGEKPLTDN